jgi:hypothetical protein
MAPPITTDEYGTKRLESDAPLSRWQVQSAVDTATLCNEGRLWVIKTSATTAQALGLDVLRAREYSEATRCIATDDPRSRP